MYISQFCEISSGPWRHSNTSLYSPDAKYVVVLPGSGSSNQLINVANGLTVAVEFSFIPIYAVPVGTTLLPVTYPNAVR